MDSFPVIGLTGLTGSGKTTVTEILKSRGGFCIVADIIAHEVMKKGKPAYEEVLSAFGQEIIAKDGEIDRRKLGEIVFGDNQKMKVLEGIIHPRVEEETWTQVKNETAKLYFAVIDAPLLIEAGMHNRCDKVWLVTAPASLRKKRIMERDQITEDMADKRLLSRKSEDELKPFANVVIVNDRDIKTLTDIVDKHVKDLLNE